MAHKIKPYELNQNFWKLNPAMALLTPFKEYYNFSGASQKETSLVMWAIWLVYDYESPIYLKEIDEKKKLAGINLFNNDKFFFLDENVEMLSKLGEAYVEITQTITQRAISSFIKHWSKRIEVLEQAELTLENCKMIDEIMVNSSKLQKTYDELVAKERMEDDAVQNMGGKELSLTDKNLI